MGRSGVEEPPKLPNPGASGKPVPTRPVSASPGASGRRCRRLTKV